MQFDKFTLKSQEAIQAAQQLAAEGAAAFMNEDYKEAVKAYTDLKDWYPFDKLAILAELKIADPQAYANGANALEAGELLEDLARAQ